MDIKQLAIQIASSEDPYTDFSKEAAALDETHQVSLAREVNKQFFLSRIADKSTDGDISFDVITPSSTDSAANSSIQKTASVLTKTASDDVGSGVRPEFIITDDMFVLQSSKRFKAKTSSSTTLLKEADDKFLMTKIASAQDIQAETNKKRENSLIFKAKETLDFACDKIANSLNSEEEVRGLVKVAMEHDLVDSLPLIVNRLNMNEQVLTKVATDEFSGEKHSNMVDTLSSVHQLDMLLKEGSDKEAIAMLTSKILNWGLTGVGALGKGALSATKGTIKSINKAQDIGHSTLSLFKKGPKKKLNGLDRAMFYGGAGITGASVAGKVDNYDKMLGIM